MSSMFRLDADVQHQGWARRGYGTKARMVAQGETEHARDGRAVRVVRCRDAAVVWERAERGDTGPPAVAAHPPAGADGRPVPGRRTAGFSLPAGLITRLRRIVALAHMEGKSQAEVSCSGIVEAALRRYLDELDGGDGQCAASGE